MTARAPRTVVAAAVTALTVVALAACRPAERAAAEPGVLEITARDFEFDAPTEIPSGWTTVRFANAGEQEHFAVLWRLPDGRTYTDYRKDVVDVFIRVWNRYDAAELDRDGMMEALGEQLPEWYFGGLEGGGGAALTEPGDTTRATVRLEPGTYVIECYVKTPKGTFHSARGMLRELTVTEEPNGVSPPEPDAELVLSNYQIEASGELGPGTHTVAVRVEENPEGLVPHDINLFRLDDGTTLEEIIAWMDWMDLEQFRAPAPGHSLGGVADMMAGSTGYATVELTPGRYAWVSEGYGARGVAMEFTVQ